MPSLVTGYIGTYTRPEQGRAKGIYSFTFNTQTGIVEDLRLAVESVNPGYLALHPSKNMLYAVNEIGDFDGKPVGALSAFTMEAEGRLKLISQKPSGSRGPAHAAVDSTGSYAVVANYGGGALSALPIDREGRLGDPVQVIQCEGKGPNEKRQESAHAHSFTFNKNGTCGFSCDLGGDKVMAFNFNPNEKKPLSFLNPPWFSSAPGAGPRLGVFSPSGNTAYFLNELASSVDVYRYNEAGASVLFQGDVDYSIQTYKPADASVPSCLTKLQTISCLPEGTTLYSIAAAVRIRGDGRFLYASNRGHNSIAVFKVLSGAQDEGKLAWVDTFPCGGERPRDFILDPAGNFLLVCNTNTDNLAVFSIDRETGHIRKEREYVVPSPIAVVLHERA
jgi:6-phosphogluconolactonase